MVSSTISLAVLLVFVGCCSNVVFLELMIKEDSGAGNTITFFQFLLISIEGVVFVSHFFTKSPNISISKYIVLVSMYFCISVINNYSLIFNIPMPLHMIFRAGSLIANMILGVIILKRRYTVSKYVSVMMITLGITIATMASAQQMQHGVHASEPDGEDEGDSNWRVFQLLFGILFLLFALFMSARMGIYQEELFSKHGKFPREAMFYNHFLPLPGFLMLAPGIWNKMQLYSTSAPIAVGFLSIPKMWAFLLANCATQYICIRGVFTLTTECPSLIVTLIITLRKFVSLLFSIFYFQNPFTIQHWMATLLVFTGTALFSGLLQSIGRALIGTGSVRKDARE